MRPDGVVVLPPAFDQHLGFVQRGEDLAVEKLVTQLAVEALVVAILLGASRFDEQPPLGSHSRTAVAVNSLPLSERM